MTLHLSLTLKMAAFLAWSSAPAPPPVVGVVMEADRVHLNSGTVSPGATIYEGDSFSTERGGMLLLRGDAAMLELAEEGVMVARRAANGTQGTEVELSAGTLAFSAARAAAIEVVVWGARIRPSGDGRTFAQVRVAGPKELMIYARRGALQFSYRGKTETIAEGMAYRVILDEHEDGARKQGAVKAARHRHVFRFVAIAGGAAVATVILHENHGHKRMESPDRP